MQPQPTTKARTRGPRWGSARNRAKLAALPDPNLELIKEADANARARARLAAAAAAGTPLLAPDGRQRSPITLPEYRLGLAPANKGKRYPAEVLTGEEMTALLDAFPAETPFGARQRALVVVMWRAGLRVGEALALYPKDLDVDRGVIVILSGKGDVRRVAAIDRPAVRYLREWIAERAALEVPESAPLFCTISRDAGGVGRPLRDSTVRESLKQYARRAGITKRVHPHALRHTHAYDLAMEGQPVHLIRAQLGHVDLETTQRYIDHLAPQTLLAAIRDRTWPGGHAGPPETRAVTSQGAPLSACSEPPNTAAALVLVDQQADRELPVSNRANERAPRGSTKREIMRLVHANGGRVTQRQLLRALRLRLATVDRHCHELATAGQLMSAGKVGVPSSNVWALPPVHASYTVQPHMRVGSIARPGSGPQRVLDALTEVGGRASQAQLAGLLGITPGTVARHCQLLEARALVTRGGLDKATSNRGSVTWALHGQERWTADPDTLRPSRTSTSTRLTWR